MGDVLEHIFNKYQSGQLTLAELLNEYKHKAMLSDEEAMRTLCLTIITTSKTIVTVYRRCKTPFEIFEKHKFAIYAEILTHTMYNESDNIVRDEFERLYGVPDYDANYVMEVGLYRDKFDINENHNTRTR